MPDKWRRDFKSESHMSEIRIEELKNRICTSGIETYDGLVFILHC